LTEFTLYERCGLPAEHVEAASIEVKKKPKLYPPSAAIIGHRAPVAQGTQRWPPEPDRLSVLAPEWDPERNVLRAGGDVGAPT
jgi:hypothetical protein